MDTRIFLKGDVKYGGKITSSRPGRKYHNFCYQSGGKKFIYAKVANELLAIKEFRGEQVGFIERHEDGSSHMEMMGGEFCGNATRSFGYLLGKEQESKDAYKKTVTVDVSGSSEKLDVEVDYEAGTSKTMMPLPEKIEEVETAQCLSLIHI